MNSFLFFRIINMYKKYHGGIQDWFANIGVSDKSREEQKRNVPPPAIGKSVNTQQLGLVTGDYNLKQIQTAMTQSLQWFKHSA